MGKEKESKEQVYCICRSSDAERFMICCDRCNEWFHGDCVHIKEKDAKNIAKYFCDECIRKEPSLVVEYKVKPPLVSEPAPTPPPMPRKRGRPPGGGGGSGVFAKKPKIEPLTESHVPKQTPTRCLQCIGCFRTTDCGKCTVCIEMKKYGGAGKQKGGCLARRCVNAGVTTVEPLYNKVNQAVQKTHAQPRSKATKEAAKMKNVSPKKSSAASASVKQEAKANIVATQLNHSTRATAKAFESFLREAGMDPEPEEIRQCLGPGCCHAARPRSKYCSNECGLALATKRLRAILPERIRRWNRQKPVATVHDEKSLEGILLRNNAARQRLEELDLRAQCIDKWVELMKEKKTENANDMADREAEHEEAEQSSVFCVVCGHETSSKSAMRHILKCFGKLESQTSYGSVHKAVNNPFNVFCDQYNKVSKTYCKRLRVICPEHSKDAKLEDDEICGYSLKGDYSDGPGQYCRVAKKKCVKHYKWERIQRACIDLERLSLLLKSEELYEQERQLRDNIDKRGNMLSLMLHDTIDEQEQKEQQVHEPVSMV